MVSLQAYAKTKTKKPTACHICTLPAKLREEVLAAHNNAGVGATMISRWLKEVHHIELTQGAINYHFRREHAQYQ